MATLIYSNILEFAMYDGRYICYLNVLTLYCINCSNCINIESLSIYLSSSSVL